MQAMHYVLLIAEVDDKEVFKICMEYFEFLGKSLYDERFVCHAPSACTCVPA